MTRTAWHLSESDGELQVHTGVAGRAARMGHRLALGMTGWRATVWLIDGEPSAAELTVDVGSLQVARSEGGLKPLSVHEVKLIKRNALKSLRADRFPHIRFHADTVQKIVDGTYRATGTLEIHGKNHARTIEMQLDDMGGAWRLSGEADVRQSDFGIKPFSLLGGTLKVEDIVKVTVDVKRAKDDES